MYGLLFLILLYSSPIFFAIESLMSTTHSTLLYIVYNVVLTIIAFLSVLIRIVNKRYRLRCSVMIFVWIALFIVMGFWLTQYRYEGVNMNYITAFLFMGVQVVPTIIMACFLEKIDIISMKRYIVVLILLFTVSVWVCIMKSGGVGLNNQAYNDEINTYASLGYSMVYAYGFSLFLLMYHHLKTMKDFFLKTAMLCLIPFQLYAIFTLGGKGPLFTAVAITFVVVVFCRKEIRLVLFSGICGGGTILLPFLSRFSSIQRFLNIAKDMSTIERIKIWKDAWQVGFTHPIMGNGIGAQYYTLGFRTHNIFMDVFVEYGIIGPIVVCIVLFITGIELLRMVHSDKENVILMVIFINAVISLLISDYYLANPMSWGVIIYVLMNKVKGKNIRWPQKRE